MLCCWRGRSRRLVFGSRGLITSGCERWVRVNVRWVSKIEQSGYFMVPLLEVQSFSGFLSAFGRKLGGLSLLLTCDIAS